MNTVIFQDYLLELLLLNSKYDILNVGSALDEIPMSRKIDLVKKTHPYSITAPTSEKGRWQYHQRRSNCSSKFHGRVNIFSLGTTKELQADKLLTF